MLPEEGPEEPPESMEDSMEDDTSPSVAPPSSSPSLAPPSCGPGTQLAENGQCEISCPAAGRRLALALPVGGPPEEEELAERLRAAQRLLSQHLQGVDDEMGKISSKIESLQLFRQPASA